MDKQKRGHGSKNVTDSIPNYKFNAKQIKTRRELEN